MGTNSKNYMKKYAQKSRQPDKVCYRCGWGIHPVTKKLIVKGLKVVSKGRETGYKMILCKNCLAELESD